jgi:hypothetical protein
VDYPNTVSASGGRYHFKDDWEFYDTLVTSYNYDDCMITWECKSCQGSDFFGRDRGSTILGTQGTVLIDRGGYEVFDLAGKRVSEVKAEKRASTQDLVGIDIMTTKHFENLINGIRDGAKLHSPIAEANISVSILLLSNIAWKMDRVLRLDKTNGHILNDPQAMSMFGREYEKGWELKI